MVPWYYCDDVLPSAPRVTGTYVESSMRQSEGLQLKNAHSGDENPPGTAALPRRCLPAAVRK